MTTKKNDSTREFPNRFAQACRVASGSLAAGLIATGGSASGQILDVDVLGTLSLHEGGQLGFDLDGDSLDDVGFVYLSPDQFGNPSFLEFGGSTFNGFGGDVTVVRTPDVVGTRGFITLLNAGDVIDSLATAMDSPTNPSFAPFSSFDAYLGFSFPHSVYGEVFAWADIESDGWEVQVNGFAFESSGEPIVAGATGVPEPSAFALLALGATAVVSRRRRESTA